MSDFASYVESCYRPCSGHYFLYIEIYGRLSYIIPKHVEMARVIFIISEKFVLTLLLVLLYHFKKIVI